MLNVSNKQTNIYVADVSPLKTAEIYDFFFESLCEERKEKASRFRFLSDKLLSVGSGILLNYALSDFGVGKNRSIGLSANGKPYLRDHPDIFFNISHSGEKVICAISHSNIGCDVEKIDADRSGIADRFFSSEEIEYLERFNKEKYSGEFYRIWTMKESFIKCTGEGLSRGLNSFSVDIDAMRIKCKEKDEYHLFEKAIDGYNISVCVKNNNNDTVVWKYVDLEKLYYKEKHH